MEAIAKTKYLKGSPRKARLVIDLIRGENVSRALSILRFTDKRAADPISRCLNSAIANATYKAEQLNIAIDPDDLWVKTCFVDMGPTKNRRRMRPAPQGRAYREQRHYCHITIEVTSDDKPKTEKELKAEAAKSKKAEAKPKAKAAAPKKEAKTKAEEVKPVEEVVVEAVEETPVAENTVDQAAEAPEIVEAAAEEVSGGETTTEEATDQSDSEEADK
ncbi:MAG: 50S ribosomal protein L22 [Chloracidobacterium sp.]|nr:50S ribosomal protein L22 [Chloracidobacterium sp.]MCC6825875.1 50S ribosomal protein L22 [Acidobacteriota bacterium]